MFWVFKIYINKCEYSFNMKNSQYTAKAKLFPTSL